MAASTSSSTSSLPSPFSFSPSQYWDGNDGSWSSFIVRIGTPPQDFRVFPSTVGQETLVPLPEGCTDHDPSNCGSLRGVMPFQGVQTTGFMTNKSSTWDSIGLYTTNLDNELGINVNGQYGFDTVGLQVENSGGIEQDHLVVAGIVDKSFMYGLLGLGPRPSNFSVFTEPKASLLTSLSNHTIPSRSYGYTAGASYRFSKVLGSLTLGGYDSSRFDATTSLSIPFASDDSKPLQVAVSQIMASQTPQGSVTLSSEGYFAVIDSTTPHIWMPQEACDQFAEAFGLEYDPSTDFYTINDTMHDTLVSLNPSIVFTISTSTYYDDSRTNIVLPYAAFDLSAGYPYYPRSTRYFPIRRAANDTQYTLGRTFLQEAYLITDYERSNFSVSQATFENRMPTANIVSILPMAYNTSTTSSSTNHNSTGGNSTSNVAANNDSPILSRNVIIGIAVGAVGGAAIVLFIGAFFFYIRHRRNKQRREEELEAEMEAAAAMLNHNHHNHHHDSNNTSDRSLDVSPSPRPSPANMELPGGSDVQVNEMPAWDRHEKDVPGWRRTHEVHGESVRGEMYCPPPELDGAHNKEYGAGSHIFELEGSVGPLQERERQREYQAEEGRRKFSFEMYSPR